MYAAESAPLAATPQDASSGAPPSSNRTFLGVQALRGIAAIMVVLHHSTLFWGRVTGSISQNNGSHIWWNGAAGVDIFFVISGFVMAVSTSRQQKLTHPARVFLKRRLVRVAPLYWIVTCLFLLEYCVLHVYPGLKTSAETYTTLSGREILASFLLLPYRHGTSFAPIVGVGWTLTYECFFYLLFALALITRRNVLYTLTPVLLVISFAGRYVTPAMPPLLGLANPMLLEFLAGVLIGRFALSRKRLPAAVTILFGLAGALGLLLPRLLVSRHRVILWGVPAALLVLAAVASEEKTSKLWPKALLLVGDASYSLYLCHILALCMVVRALEGSVLHAGVVLWSQEILVAALCLAASLLLALPLYFGVEQPVNRLLRHGLSHLRPEKRAVSASG